MVLSQTDRLIEILSKEKGVAFLKLIVFVGIAFVIFSGIGSLFFLVIGFFLDHFFFFFIGLALVVGLFGGRQSRR